MVAALREQGLLRGEEEYTHSVPFSHRSGERIEPLISLQWFCRMDELAAPAIEVVERDEVRITPEQHKRVYLDWMNNIRPWCISRQLWWGHRLPVWYAPERRGDRRRVRAARARARRPSGASIPTRCARTTMSSTPGSARRCGRSRPSAGRIEDAPLLGAFYPTDVLVTARDILFLWVARMVMMGIEFAGERPFDDVYITAIIQAPDGRRMSKSLGTGIDPLDEIEVHGADALRFGLLAMASTQDVRYSADRVQQGRDLANKMWNASRLILLNAGDARPERRAERVEDRWILSRLERTDRVRERAASTPTTSRTRCSSSTRSSGRSSATGTWRSSSRGSTTATRTPPPTCCASSSGCSRSPIR